MLTQPTFDLLHELRLPGMAAALTEQEAMPDVDELDFHDRLSLLLEREKIDREARCYQRLLGQARLHLDATIENLNFRKTRVWTVPWCCGSPTASGSGRARAC